MNYISILTCTTEKSNPISTIRRATQQNIDVAAARVADHVREHNLQLGPLQTRYTNVVTARLPVNAPIELPTTATMTQLGHIDDMTALHAAASENRVLQEQMQYRRVRMSIFVSNPFRPLRSHPRKPIDQDTSKIGSIFDNNLVVQSRQLLERVFLKLNNGFSINSFVLILPFLVKPKSCIKARQIVAWDRFTRCGKL